MSSVPASVPLSECICQGDPHQATCPPPLDTANKPYYWNSSGDSYIYYPQPMSATAGEQWCRDNGGHLISYVTEKEQIRVRGLKCTASCTAKSGGGVGGGGHGASAHRTLLSAHNSATSWP